MILFEEDWETYPNAIIDTETKNTSFIELAALYREMGIKNNAFILQLHNTELQGVDPYDPNLTHDQAIAIGLECKQNFWYWIREIARDPQGSGEFPIRLKINRGLVAAYWLFFNYITIFLIMIRQTGKSFGLDWLYLYLAFIRMTKSDISILTLNEKLRGRELERLKMFEHILPSYLKQRRRTDPANTEIMKVSGTGNTIRFFVPSLSKIQADRVGRGMSSGVNGADEFAYIPNNHITIPVMLSAMSAAAEVARMKNEPTGAIFSTTSGKRDTIEGAFAFKKVMEAATMNEAFFDLQNYAMLEEVIRGMSKNRDLTVNCTYNHRQLGFTDEWLRERMKKAMVEDPVQARADYFNQWPSGTGSDIFSQETMETIRKSESPEFHAQYTSPGLYQLRWYYPEAAIKTKLLSAPHILSIDPSEAVNRDAIGVILDNAHTGETAMAADITITNIGVFALWLVEFIVQNPRVTVIIERKSTGIAIIDLLLLYLPQRDINPFTRLYNDVVDEAESKKERYSMIQGQRGMRDETLLQHKATFGWATAGSGKTSRSELYSTTLNSMTRYCATMMRDTKLIHQTLGLEVRNGRIDHQENGHDDLVIAKLLVHWLLTKGKNLRYYGIEPSEILSKNPERRVAENRLNYYERERQIQYRARVEQLTKDLGQETDPYVIERLERDLIRIGGELIQDDNELISIDALINKIREDRTAFSRSNSSYGSSPYPTELVYKQ